MGRSISSYVASVEQRTAVDLRESEVQALHGADMHQIKPRREDLDGTAYGVEWPKTAVGRRPHEISLPLSSGLFYFYFIHISIQEKCSKISNK